MEDSLKGLYISITLIGIFIVCITSFMFQFPQEQGYTFSGEDNDTLTLIQEESELDIDSIMSSINNRSGEGFIDWDITQGFMGSNTIKQSSLGISDYIRLIFSSLIRMATGIFGQGSPVLIVLSTLLTLSLGVAVYYFIAWVRSGR